MKASHLRHVKKAALRFDLRSEVPSRLPAAVREMLAEVTGCRSVEASSIELFHSQVTDVSMYVEQHRSVGADADAMPFGRTDRAVVLAAQDMLGRLETLAAAMVRLTQRKRKRMKAGASDVSDGALYDCMKEISELSSEYYYLLPKSGFEYTRLPVLDAPHLIEAEQKRVAYMLDLEATERLLLAAQFRRAEVNPLDYIYRALDCRVAPLARDSAEAGIVLQYMYNADGAADGAVVDGIYKVTRADEAGLLPGANLKTADLNRRLLWHGTKAANLLGILGSGLVLNAKSAPVSGKSYGDGIYSADHFDHSWSFTFDHRDDGRSGGGGGHSYLFLCDVALGRSLAVREGGVARRDSTAYPPKAFDSVCVHGSLTPDPYDTLDRGRRVAGAAGGDGRLGGGREDEKEGAGQLPGLDQLQRVRRLRPEADGAPISRPDSAKVNAALIIKCNN